MEGGCPQLLNLIPKERKWLVKREVDEKESSEENKLELTLGPPGERWSSHHKHANTINRERDESLLSLGYSFPSGKSNFSPPERGSVWFSQQQQQGKGPSFLQSSSQILPVMGKESPQRCRTKVVPDLQQQQQQNSTVDKKAFSLPPTAAAPPNTAVPNTSQKRTAPGPVVGWPPIRSFRKNLASSSSSSRQAPAETLNRNPSKKVASESPAETSKKGLFVKINMDGVPIGRKVDLKSYDSYEKLSTAVDELFRGLLAAQSDSCTGGIMNKQEEENAITGSGEYTLVYEDNEGDRMLVGDVPWHMFVSTVKRLRVLKSSEVSALSLGSGKQDRSPLK